MNTRLRIVPAGERDDDRGRGPGRSDEAGMMRVVVMVSPAARGEGALARRRDRAGAVMQAQHDVGDVREVEVEVRGRLLGGGIVSVHCSPCTGQAA
jgi:hypothetical protein